MKRVLIVEDEERIRAIYSQLLREQGMEVIEAADAWEGTDAIILEKLDLVLLDLNLPQIDGKDFFTVVHEHDPEIKIMVASVYPIEKQKSLVPQAVDYFDKSQGSEVLLQKIRKILF